MHNIEENNLFAIQILLITTIANKIKNKLL